MQLRQYQLDAVEKACNARTNLLLVSPTGSGKTIVGAEIARRTSGRVLWVTHRIELAEQAKRALLASTGHDALISFGRDLPGNLERCAIVSPATIKNRDLTYYPDIVIIDEAHHAAANTWRDLFDRLGNVRRIGLTATPQRYTGAGLGDLFDELYEVTDHETLVYDGNLVPLRVFAPSMPSRDLAQSIVSAVMEYAECRPTIVFANSLQESKLVVETLNRLGVRSAHVDGESSDRSESVEGFKSGRYGVLSGVGVFLEGFDAPLASCAIVARKFQYPSTWMQACGRISRPAPGKIDGKIIDLCGNIFDLDHPYAKRVYSLEDKPISGRNTSCSQCLACGRVYAERPKECLTDGCPGDWVTRTPRKLTRDEKAREMKEIYEAQTLDFKKKWLAKQVALGKKLGFKPTWAPMQFKSRYGFWPEWWRQ